MANQDSFIDEVTEEVRRDRLFKLFRRYGWIAITLVVLLVAGAAFNEWRKASARAQAEATGDALIAALETADPTARSAALRDILPPEGSESAALVALLTAGSDLEAGDRAAAIAGLEALAADPDTSAVYRDLATLKAVMVAGPLMAPDERVSRLQGLSLPGAPFRLLALEQMALAEIDRAAPDAAIVNLREIVQDNAASEGLRRRAAQLIVALGGTIDGG